MIESFHLYLNGRQARFRRQSGFPWQRKLVELPLLEWSAQDMASLDFNALDIGKRRRAAPLHVCLGSALCKFMLVDMPSDAVDEHEQSLIAEARMRQHFGLHLGEWIYKAYVGKVRTQAVVCAVRADLVAHIRSQAGMHGLKLVSLQPYAAILWNLLVEQFGGQDVQQAGLLAVEDDAFTLFLAKSDVVTSLNALIHNREVDLVERELRRVGLSAGMEMRDAVRLAVSNEFAGAAVFDRNRLLVRTEDRSNMLEHDFRDLLIGTVARA